MAKPILVERAALLSAVFLLIGLLPTMAGTYLLSTEGLEGSKGWSYWLISIGVILLLVGVLWMVKLNLAIRKFQTLIQEKSKATFLKNLDEMEYLAWRLPSAYGDELALKKEEFKLK